MPEKKRVYHLDSLTEASFRLEPTKPRREALNQGEQTHRELRAEKFNPALIERLIDHFKEN